MKIVIPMAGYGKRLRPLTWSRPKPLLTLADKPMLGHVLEMFAALPAIDEVVFIVGHLGEQIAEYAAQYHGDLKARFVEQSEPLGQSHAIWLARDKLEGPMLMIFVDTLIHADLSVLAREEAEAVAWVCKVPDPRRFGVARLTKGDRVSQLIEKPKNIHENLAVVGFYYFQDAERLIAAIAEQMRRKLQLKGEYFLVDAINLMLEDGLDMRVENVDAWNDCGTPQAMLETNRYLLENGRDNSDLAAKRENVEIIPPVYVHSTADVRHVVVGPHVSIGADCVIEHATIRNSIIEKGCRVVDSTLSSSLLGRDVNVAGVHHSLILGDGSQIQLSQPLPGPA